MKKKILLITLLIIGLTLPCFAAQKTKANTFAVGQVISSAHVNENFDDIYNEFNGSIDGGAAGNIAADTLTEREMADEINPRVRWDEGFQDFVSTGLLGDGDEADLTSDISAGTCYVDGYRVNKASATSKTYTDDKDTWCEINKDGTFNYQVVDHAAAQPSTTANYMMLFCITSEGTKLVGVTDVRDLTAYTTGSARHMISRGFEIANNVTDAAHDIDISPGTLYHGIVEVNTTTTDTIQLDVNGDWIDGSLYSFAGGAGWAYVYETSAGVGKFDENAPDKADTSGNTTGTKYYYRSGATDYRCIGAVYVQTDNTIDAFFQRGNVIMWDIPVAITTTVSSGAWKGATSCATGIPAISEAGFFGLMVTQAANSIISIRPFGSNWPVTDEQENGIYGTTRIAGQRFCLTDSSQQIDYYNGTATATTAIDVEGYILKIK